MLSRFSRDQKPIGLMQAVCLPLVAMVAGVATPVGATEPDPARLAAMIDSHMAKVWKESGVQPAAAADDATFLRRVTLDLIGRIPTTAEAVGYFEDSSPDKEARLISRLLSSGEHSRHMATFWRRTWIPQADTPQLDELADEIEPWITVRLRENQPYDRIVRELLTVSAPSGITTASSPGHVSAAAFLTANENRPENLAASASRAFLGVNLDCAQCHNHPFARWTRDQFWQTAAFFAAPRKDTAGRMVPASLTIPNTERSVSPLHLDSTPVRWPDVLDASTGKTILASWVTGKENPYFARNAVNRLWAQLYGTALVEPLDDLSGEAAEDGPHVELLGKLAEEFIHSGHDLKYLTRALVRTRAYQLSSVSPKGAATDPQLFARMPVRGLTGEQAYDSLRTAAGLAAERGDLRSGQGMQNRKQIAAMLHVERAVSAERSILQTLLMMNGELVTELTDPARNRTLATLVSAPFLNSREKLDLLFLAVLGRRPTEQQAARLIRYIEREGMQRDSGRALGDVFWALVNSTEFNTNH